MKNMIKGTNATVLSLAVVGIFIVLTIFLHSLKGTQFDLTKNKKFSLSDSTITTLANLDKPVNVIAFTDPGAGVINRQVKDLLEEYHKRNSKFTYEEVDPKKKPTIAEQYQIDQYGTIVFESEGKTKYLYSDDLFGQGQSENTYAFSGEEKFTRAIQSLVSGEKHKVYFITGHGELTSSNAAALKSSLENENYEVADLNIVKEAKIPDDAETVFVLGPQVDISDSEANVLQAYLKDKGKLLFALDLAKDMEQWKNWPAILGIYGVKSMNAMAIEAQQALAQDPRLIVPQYRYSDITKKLDQEGRITLLPIAMALSSSKDNSDYSAQPLLNTTDKSFGKTNLSAFTGAKRITTNDLKKTDADLKGPFDLAYAIQGVKDSKPKAIIIGNGTMMSNEFFTQQGNRDFILNSIGWLQEQKNLITIRPQEEAQLQQAFITPGKLMSIFIGLVVVFPLLFVVTGGVIWWRRRKG